MDIKFFLLEVVMRKAFVIMIAVILLLGVSGCESVPVAREEINLIDAANASNIAAAINAFNALHMSSVRPVSDNTTLEEAKGIVGEELWPEGISEEEERAAWGLIVVKDDEAELVPEAREALQVTAKYAWLIVGRINIYHTLNPSEVTNFESLKIAKSHIGEYLWPAGLSEEEERAAWELIVIDDWTAYLTSEAQQALQEGSRDESGRVKIANATIIAADINIYNAFKPNSMLPDDMTLAEVKETIGEWWPYMTDAEVEEAWELLEIKDGKATVKREG